ncbi:MarR family transcriptional regulator [Rubrivivax sp. RP6-9]|uniref:MarR family transcriptional regulator n=1 Tax=Rubrivivax sp. RP6-9 TaxID=3415750 RepID=UPI003CC6AEFF
MPQRKALDETPAGRLAETGLQGILGYQLAQARLTTDEVFLQSAGRRLALRPVEFTILALLDHNPGVSARQLARALAVTPPNLTTWLERLERRGLIARVRSESDRRTQPVMLTPEGAALARQAAQDIIAAEAAAVDNLSPAERALLLELLHKVAARRPRPA